MYLHLCVCVYPPPNADSNPNSFHCASHTHTHSQPALPSRRTIEHASFARYEWKTRCVRVLWVRVARGMGGGRSRLAGGHLLAWVSERKKIIAYLRGQTKTNGSARESGQGGAGRAGAVLTVYLTYDVNVSAAVIVWQNWSTTHTHTLTRMCMHFTTHYTTTNTCAAAEREQCTRRQQRRRRRRNRCPLLITFIFNTLTGSALRAEAEAGGRRIFADVSFVLLFLLLLLVLCLCWYTNI